MILSKYTYENNHIFRLAIYTQDVHFQNVILSKYTYENNHFFRQSTLEHSRYSRSEDDPNKVHTCKQSSYLLTCNTQDVHFQKVILSKYAYENNRIFRHAIYTQDVLFQEVILSKYAYENNYNSSINTKDTPVQNVFVKIQHANSPIF